MLLKQLLGSYIICPKKKYEESEDDGLVAALLLPSDQLPQLFQTPENFPFSASTTSRVVSETFAREFPA